MEVNPIEVESVSKTYPRGDSQIARLRYIFGGAARAASGITALEGVSFKVARGEAFGIVGANGSGKSTLLKILAGILRPSAGSVHVRGRLSALLELGAGFAPDFTGRESVYINASILGFGREEIAERFSAIESFASIGDFIDQPIRTYSTGMVLRLAFAVAAHVDPEILMVDEALAVGDIAFRQRCMRRIHDLRARGATILFVSHDAMDVKALCDRCLWLDTGRVRGIGDADEVVANYLQTTLHVKGSRDIFSVPPPQITKGSAARRFGDGRAEVVIVDLLNRSGVPVRTLEPGYPMSVRIGAQARAHIDSPILGFILRNERGESIFGSNTARENYPIAALEPGHECAVEFHWIAPELSAGRYFLSMAISDGDVDTFRICDYIEDAIALEIKQTHPPVGGYMRLRCDGIEVARE